MFKIDKSSVEFIDSNKEIVVIKQWLRQNVGEIADQQDEIEEPQDNVIKITFENNKKESADAILLRAEQQAQRLIDDAREQADQIRRLAKQEAIAQEIERAEALCEQIQANNAEQLNQALTKLFEMQAQCENVLEQRVVQLSLEVAQKILNIELEKNDTVFEDVIRKAVRKINIKNECILRLNAREYQRHFSDGGKWLAQEIDTPYSIVVDNTVPPGGCVVELQDCVVRVGVDAQIKMIAMALNQ